MLPCCSRRGSGVHGPIGVVLTRDGEVWTWGMILGDPPTMKARLAALEARIAGNFHFKIPAVDPEPVYRENRGNFGTLNRMMLRLISRQVLAVAIKFGGDVAIIA